MELAFVSCKDLDVRQAAVKQDEATCCQHARQKPNSQGSSRCSWTFHAGQLPHDRLRKQWTLHCRVLCLCSEGRWWWWKGGEIAVHRCKQVWPNVRWRVGLRRRFCGADLHPRSWKHSCNLPDAQLGEQEAVQRRAVCGCLMFRLAK